MPFVNCIWSFRTSLFSFNCLELRAVVKTCLFVAALELVRAWQSVHEILPGMNEAYGGGGVGLLGDPGRPE